MNIAVWLQSLGLERYVPAFRDNDVDAEVLPSLTTEDLISIGVTSVGHRRKLLDAIVAFRAEVPAVASAAPGEAPAAPTAERRHLTVMFCDLVGSTALSTALDPEDLREIIGAYHRCVAEAVARFDGFVAKYMGDGVLVYFGYPQAHEDDAEQAVRTGLAIVDEIGRVEAPDRLQVHIGIASGEVVVGDLLGSGASQEQAVVGETPNLAARLQALAESGAVVIDPQTRRQTARLFEYADLGPVELKGFAQQIQAWRVIRESNVASRFEALRSRATPLVGREEELDLLLRRWQQAKEGEGRVVLISGEPGIGKSRITEALHERLKSEPHTRLRYFCSPHHQDSAFYPVIAQLERAARFARDDAVDVKLGKLKALVALAAPGHEEVGLLAEMLSLADPELQAGIRDFSPPRKKEQTFAALLDQLKALARQRPVLVIFEDVHWIDPSSRELLDLLIERVRELPALLVVTFRPEFQPAWLGRPEVTSLGLNRLDRREGSALVQAVAGNAALPEEVVNEVFERADGVPLFVEELTKAVLEAADRDDGVAAVLSTAPSPALSVPATLNASLIARLDRLGPSGREIAQIGAVLGREFPYELIRPVSGRRDAELSPALDRLTESGLLFCRGIPPHATYQFKHALVQDAAYGTLLRGKRQEHHARVAAVLEERFGDVLERQPELLAHHLTSAGDTERAVEQWLKAGEHAAARSAHLEAIGHFRRGLAVLASLPEALKRERHEIELQLAMGTSSFAAKGFGSSEAALAYTRARELCEKSGDTQHLFAALWGLWLSNQSRNAFEAARRISDRLLELTRTEGDRGRRLQAHHTAWTTRFFHGEPALCSDHCQEGLRLYDPGMHRSHALLYGGHDPGVCAGNMLGFVQWLLGYPDRAAASSTNASALAEQLAHPFSWSTAHIWAAVLHQFRREPEASLSRVIAAEVLVAEHRLAAVFNLRVLRGGALLAKAGITEAVARLREGLADQTTGGHNQLLRPYGFALLAEALSQAGDVDGALSAAAEGLALAEESGERWWEAELHRLKGVLLESRRNLGESEACFERSIRIAQQQQAKSLELRGAMSLARLWRDQGKGEQAHDLLAPVYGWFTEGFDTPDLKDAKALLGELA